MKYVDSPNTERYNNQWKTAVALPDAKRNEYNESPYHVHMS